MAETISNSVTKRCAVVTGAHRGIGLEICRQLASHGITVVLTAIDEKGGLEAVANLREYGLSDVVFHQLDVTDSISIASLANFIQTHYGKLDILVNNAGVSGVLIDWEAVKALNLGDELKDGKTYMLEEFTTQTCEMAEECLKVNYYGTRGVTEALLPFLKLSNSARIVNISSVKGKLEFVSNERAKEELSDVNVLTEERLDELVNGFLKDFKEDLLETKGWPTHVSAYIVSKLAVTTYTRILAKKFPTLCINCVCPGYVRTDINNNTGVLTVEEGSRGPVMLALLPDGGPTGQFFDKMELSTFD